MFAHDSNVILVTEEMLSNVYALRKRLSEKASVTGVAGEERCCYPTRVGVLPSGTWMIGCVATSVIIQH